MKITKERRVPMKPWMIRVGENHKVMVKRLAAKDGIGEAEYVRKLIEDAFMKNA